MIVRDAILDLDTPTGPMHCYAYSPEGRLTVLRALEAAGVRYTWHEFNAEHCLPARRRAALRPGRRRVLLRAGDGPVPPGVVKAAVEAFGEEDLHGQSTAAPEG